MNPLTAGCCFFFTGLSGAGKSTIADALVAAIQSQLCGPVTLLDGDVVRQHLCSDLGFSKADRETNLQRIAFVASEVVKHGGVAVVAAIAPYAASRDRAYQLIRQHGVCVEIHVSTPLQTCEARDVKGLYAKARAGEIQQFTGISDPYETPNKPDIAIDTTNTSQDLLAANIAKIWQFAQQKTAEFAADSAV